MEKEIKELPGYECGCFGKCCEKVPDEKEAGKVINVCHEGHEDLPMCPYLK